MIKLYVVVSCRTVIDIEQNVCSCFISEVLQPCQPARQSNRQHPESQKTESSHIKNVNFVSSLFEIFNEYSSQ